MSGERYVVVGLRRSGLASLEALRRTRPDAALSARDDAADVDLARLRELDVEYRPGDEPVSMSGVTALVKSPGVFVHYYKNDAATAETKTQDGWVHTGDAGFFEPDGQLKIIEDHSERMARLVARIPIPGLAWVASAILRVLQVSGR